MKLIGQMIPTEECTMQKAGNEAVDQITQLEGNQGKVQKTGAKFCIKTHSTLEKWVKVPTVDLGYGPKYASFSVNHSGT